MVYFIQGAETKRIKIGESDRPVKRLKELQTGSSERLFMLAVLVGGRRREHELHQKFKDFRVHNEWFEYKGEFKQYVDSLLHDDTHDGLAGTAPCKVCGVFVTSNLLNFHTNEDIESHSQQHLAIRDGGYPHEIREHMKELGHAILSGSDSLSIAGWSKDDAKRLIAYAWWARVRQNGLPDKDFEDYILDQLDYLNPDVDEAQKKIISERWKKY